MNRTEIAHIKAMAAAFVRSIRWVGKIPAAIMTLVNIPLSTIVDGEIFRSGNFSAYSNIYAAQTTRR
jgi:hypothetical protein